MNQTTPKLTFIGVGNMAGAIIGGLIANGYPATAITGTNRTEEKRQHWNKIYGIHTTDDNNTATADADIVILAVKPQMMAAIVQDMSPALQQHKPLLVSIAAGPTISNLNKWAGGNMAIVRCMPNTPSMLQCGAAGLFANDQVTEEQKAQAESIMAAVGITQWVENEAGIDSIIAISGSGPAYYYLFMEAMIEAGIKQGFNREAATELTVQTALGAARMVKESDTDVVELRRQVTSPGGTTEQAINTFEQGSLRALVDDAMQAAIKRSKELSEA